MSGQLDELKASHQEQPTVFYFYREICLCICICLRIRECALNHRGRVLVHTLRPRWKKGTTGDWQEKLRFAWVGSLSNVDERKRKHEGVQGGEDEL